MNGWIKLHRKITENPIFQNSDMFKLWALCLMKASHKDHEQLVGHNIVQLHPGQFITGRNSLAEEFNKGVKKDNLVSARTLWRYLHNFQKWQMLSIKSTTKYSVISINNWHEYQDNDQQLSNNWPTTVQQLSTNKNGKNGKNDKNINNIQQQEDVPAEQGNENPFVMYQECFGKFPSPLVIDDINAYINNGMEGRVAAFAIYKASKNGQSWNYARGILNRWENAKIQTYEQAVAEEDKFKKRYQQKKKGRKDSEVIPDWFKEQEEQQQDQPKEKQPAADPVDLQERIKRLSEKG